MCGASLHGGHANGASILELEARTWSQGVSAVSALLEGRLASEPPRRVSRDSDAVRQMLGEVAGRRTLRAERWVRGYGWEEMEALQSHLFLGCWEC